MGKDKYRQRERKIRPVVLVKVGTEVFRRSIQGANIQVYMYVLCIYINRIAVGLATRKLGGREQRQKLNE
jgi:hypothetical protein